MDVSTYSKVNLGCGQFPKEGYLNVDISTETKADLIANLDEYPYPLPDNQFEEIISSHMIEHLTNPYDFMKEIHRVLKPGGKLKIRMPHFSRGFTHWDHKRGFDATFPYYFDPSFKGGYTGIEFECAKIKFCWFSQPYLKKTVMGPLSFTIGKVLGTVFDFFANLSPLTCSRIWCFWVGGFEEMQIEFVKR